MKILLLHTVVASATLAVAAHAQGVTGDAKAGESKAAMCIGCHGIPGYQNSFPEIHKVPMISGQSAGYISAALQAYRKGDRKHPTMRGIAGSLSDQDIADLAAFYSGHNAGVTAPAQPRAASAAVAALLEKGACASCHGANFSQPIDPSYPKIAGQHADYLYVALKSYAVQGNPHIGRANPIMGGIVQQFSLSELKQLANYLATVQGELATKPQPRFR
ncbi:c-type cytochrome [Tepidimonas charontis]|uniref:Cytochrome c4 n=1 Tax=Tepidimonas charontis TaxID=2267262 RepID=A0A554XFV0_9BURK|nr:c-type cytochrome [Tepidimonas charontis]TSE34706.1 Cytochrome c4 [Tepidimonas charontis]